MTACHDAKLNAQQNTWHKYAILFGTLLHQQHLDNRFRNCKENIWDLLQGSMQLLPASRFQLGHAASLLKAFLC